MILAAILLHSCGLVFARETMPDSLVKGRIAAVRESLERGKSGANLWWTGWLAGYGAATVGQGIAAATSGEKRTHQDMALGAATTGLGVIGQLIAPMIPASALRRFDAFPDTTPDARLDKLARGEDLLRQCAGRQREGRSWKTHAITGLVNLGGGLVTWLGFKRCIGEGIGYFALNTLITEAQIWSQPTRAASEYDEYVRLHPSAAKAERGGRGLSLTFGWVPGGLGVCARF
jgi:hypothetical protein